MSKISLAVKYRPQTFDDVVEQDAVKDILKEQLQSKTFQHAYLFTGPAGCSKTTLSRILANEINDHKGAPIEIDGASNNSVENVRNIIEESKHKSLDSEYKIYIIDECHALSNGAWQAMLKLLEEPPKFAIFILCTTDPQKIPATIMSRVQRYQINKISTTGIFNRLCYIYEQENYVLSDSSKEAISFISRLAQGGMRDAITNLDKCLSYGDLTLDNVVTALGNADYDDQFSLLEYLYNKDSKESVALIEEIFNSGKSLKIFMQQFQIFLIDVAKYLTFKSFKYSQIPELTSYIERINNYDCKNIIKLVDLIKDINATLKWDTDPRYTIETTFFILGESK